MTVLKSMHIYISWRFYSSISDSPHVSPVVSNSGSEHSEVETSVNHLSGDNDDVTMSSQSDIQPDAELIDNHDIDNLMILDRTDNEGMNCYYEIILFLIIKVNIISRNGIQISWKSLNAKTIKLIRRGYTFWEAKWAGLEIR